MRGKAIFLLVNGLIAVLLLLTSCASSDPPVVTETDGVIKIGRMTVSIPAEWERDKEGEAVIEKT